MATVAALSPWRVLAAIVAIGFLASAARGQCTDQDQDGYSYEAGCGTAQDCNDTSGLTNPGAVESCDGYDNNCDDRVDEAAECNRSCDQAASEGPQSPLTPPDIGRGFAPSICWTGSEFGIAWQDERNGNQGTEIYFERRAADGSGLGTAVQITNAIGQQNVPSLIWTGSNFALAWADQRDNPGATTAIYFARLDALGNKIGGDVRVTFGFGSAYEPSLVWTGSEYAVAWRDERDDPSNPQIYFTRLDRTGNKTGSDIRITPTPWKKYTPSLVWTGSGFFVVWMGSPTFNYRSYLTRLDRFGQRIDNDIQVSTSTANSEYPSLQWTGSEVGVVWNDLRVNPSRLGFARFDSDGRRLGPETEIAGNSTYAVVYGPQALAWSGAEYAVVFSSVADGNSEIYFSRLDPYGRLIGASTRITNDPASSAEASIVWSGSRYGAAWEDRRDNGQPLPRVFFDRIGCACSLVDQDGDGVSACQGDCADHDPSIFPAAAEVCDALNNNCASAHWPRVPVDEHDLDADQFLVCEGDCDDADPLTFPGATDICDGQNNNCSDVSWPNLPSTELDEDADGFKVCQQDCNDTNSAVHPGASEVCNGIDDNCSGNIDEDGQGVDSDGDGIHNVCDNCRFAFNPTQLDTDGDLVGNACDNCALASNSNQADTDADQRGDVCDNCVSAYNPFQDDFDGDRTGDACDNCAIEWNPTQSDFNHDNEGDLCDLNDGLIYIYSTDRDYREWQAETGFGAWNSYRGSLAALRATGAYTQPPGSSPLVVRDCGLSDPWVLDSPALQPGDVAFTLVTGVSGGVESSLGTNSAGVPRQNDNPCP